METSLGPVSLDRTGEGPDLVLLHSLLSDRRVFDRVLAALARRWRVHALDLPGFGDTPLVAPRIDAYADLVGAFLREGGLDPSTTALLGNGLGGFVALGTAVRHGDAFERLVLVGCGATFPEEGKQTFEAMIGRVEEGGMRAVTDVAVLRIFTAEYLEAHPEMGEERREVLARTRPEAFIRACRALQGVDYLEAVEKVANPTLVVVGSEDAATPPGLARELAARMPDARLREMAGVAHAPQLQAPDRFLEVIGPFLGLAETPTG